MKPTNIKQLQAQSRRMQARRVDRHTLAVQSTSNPMANHIVTVEFHEDGTVHARCTCPWAINRGVACTHVMAALEYLAAMKNRTLSFWTSEEEARRQKHRVFYLTHNDHDDEQDEGVWITSRVG
ncbi:MAG: SWIM zinc finger domain-containing protein [Anaerolineae bacterium]|nr:SWIM zinc finger domain-containing protein [Anaerolineae bacterium]